MAEADIGETTATPAALVLDPFSYLDGTASRIAGLGGNSPGHDPAYVFHTHYVEAAQGPAHFTVQFTNLTARRGTLVLRVHMLRDEEGAHATLANSDRIALNRLVAQGGRTDIRFEGFRNMRYALVARIADDTDAHADDITITLDRPAVAVDPEEVTIDARATDFGSQAGRPTPHLILYERPSLARPSSQPATIPQTREPEFEQWRRQAGPAASPLLDWQHAYILQALASYGMLQRGAHAAGFGPADSVLPGAIAGLGVDVLAVTHGEESQPHPPAAPGLELRIAHLAAIPRDIVNRDFVWSLGLPEQLNSIPASLAFFEEAMNCLRPGGIAVHSFGYVLDVDAGGMQARVPPLIRADFERIALNLVSRGHEVGQIRLDDSRPLTAARGSPRSAFGLIARKGAAAF